MSENLPELSEIQKKIIEMIEGNERITHFQMAKIIGVEKNKVILAVIDLKNKNILQRVGPRKGGTWHIISDFKK